MISGFDGVSTLYLDANILIYFIEGAPELRARVRYALAQADKRAIALATSQLTIAECLRGAWRRRDQALVDVYRAFFSAEDLVRPVAVDTEILAGAAEFAASYQVKLIDAIHVASAVSAGCQALLTNDKRLRAPAALRALQLGELEK